MVKRKTKAKAAVAKRVPKLLLLSAVGALTMRFLRRKVRS